MAAAGCFRAMAGWSAVPLRLSPMPASCPTSPFGRRATSSAMAFEFSHGTELIVGNCGPAPAELFDSKPLFRGGTAHTGPTINACSADESPRGPLNVTCVKPRPRRSKRA